MPYIKAIHEMDAFSDDKESYIGKRIRKVELSKSDITGYVSCECISPKTCKRIFFRAVKISEKKPNRRKK